METRYKGYYIVSQKSADHPRLLWFGIYSPMSNGRWVDKYLRANFTNKSQAKGLAYAKLLIDYQRHDLTIGEYDRRVKRFLK